MLQELTIDNYALIDHTDLKLDGGMSVITGETGAGKSIMLGALGLLIFLLTVIFCYAYRFVGQVMQAQENPAASARTTPTAPRHSKSTSRLPTTACTPRRMPTSAKNTAAGAPATACSCVPQKAPPLGELARKARLRG